MVIIRAVLVLRPLDVTRYDSPMTYRMYSLKVEVGRYIADIADISPISIYRYRYRIGTLDIGFSIYRYRIGDKLNIGNFSIFYHTLSDFLTLV